MIDFSLEHLLVRVALRPESSAYRESGECHSCIHRRSVPGDCHIACSKPDTQMTGNPHGMRNGWFEYPLVFDPIWKARPCRNFTKEVSTA